MLLIYLVHEAGSDVMCSDKDYTFTYPDVELTDSFNNNLGFFQNVDGQFEKHLIKLWTKSNLLDINQSNDLILNL